MQPCQARTPDKIRTVKKHIPQGVRQSEAHGHWLSVA